MGILYQLNCLVCSLCMGHMDPYICKTGMQPVVNIKNVHQPITLRFSAINEKKAILYQQKSVDF